MDEVSNSACDGLAGAEERMIGGVVRDLFASDRILLVSECERDLGDQVLVSVMQRCGEGVARATVKLEFDVVEAEGAGAGFVFVAGACAFSGAHEPEEGGDCEVDRGAVGFSVDGVFEVEDFIEVLEDGGVDGLDARGRVVFVAQGGEVRSA